MRRLFGLWPGTVPAQHLACGSGRADSWAHLHQSVQLFTRVVSGAARSPGKMGPGQLSLLERLLAQHGHLPSAVAPPPHIRSARRVLSCKWRKGSWAVSATLCHSRCASPRSSPRRKASKPLAGVSFDVYSGTIRILYGYTVIEASAD